MPTYIVTFEINDSNRRETVKKLLREYGTFCPIHGNAWAINSPKTAKEIRDQLMEYMAVEDRLFVIRSGTEAAWKYTYGDDNTDWLKKFL
jgi:hypothetical protein